MNNNEGQIHVRGYTVVREFDQMGSYVYRGIQWVNIQDQCESW